MSTSSQECARELLEVVPHLMRAIRAEMRRYREPGLSVPQFRALVYLRRQEGASLSQVAEHMGMSLPSMSKLVEGLVVRELATRQSSAGDRRRVVLSLTPRGKRSLRSAHHAAETGLATVLRSLTDQERALVVSALQVLRRGFIPTPEPGSTSGGA